MNIIGYSILFALLIWSIFYEQSLFLIYLLTITSYIILSSIMGRKALKLVRRKVQIATWDDIGDPTCFGQIELKTKKIDEFLKNYNKKNQSELTYLHVALKALGQGFGNNGSLNGKLVFGSFVKSDSVDLCLILNLKNEKFEYVIVEGCNKLSINKIAEQIEIKKKALEGKKGLEKFENWFFLKYLPTYFLEIILTGISFCSYTLGIDIPFLGIKKNHYGYGLVMDVSSYNIENVHFPLSNLTKSVSVTTVNKAYEKVLVENGEVVVGKVMNLNFSVDHRFADGKDIIGMTDSIKEVWDSPEKFLD